MARKSPSVACGGSTDPDVLVEHLKTVVGQCNQSDTYSFNSRNCPKGLVMYLGRITDAENGLQETVETIQVPEHFFQ